MRSAQRIPLPVIGVSLLIIGIVAIYYVDQYSQTYQPTPEAPVFSYASPESQGTSQSRNWLTLSEAISTKK
jgi:hypothetical protein